MSSGEGRGNKGCLQTLQDDLIYDELGPISGPNFD